MERRQNNSKKEKLDYLKKQNNISSYGPYVEMCFNAMIHLKEYKGYEISDERLYERNYIISLSYMMGKYDGKKDKMSGLIVGGEMRKDVFDNCLLATTEGDDRIEKTRNDLHFSSSYV